MNTQKKEFDKKLLDSAPLWFCLALCPIFIFAFLIVALFSLTYPFQLEWMEGSTIDIIQRIRSGLPVYTQPSMEYVPYSYTPFYFYASSAMSWLTGVSFLPARLVSLLAALGTGGIIFQWIRKESGHPAAALIGATLFFASYQITGRWFDVARVDSLFVMLSMAALYSFYFLRGSLHTGLTVILMLLAFFTKQSAFIIFLPVFFAMLSIDRRYTAKIALLLGLSLLVIIGYLNVVTDNWFNFFVFELPSHHTIQQKHIEDFWTNDLFNHAAIAMILALISLRCFVRQDSQSGLFYSAMTLGLILCSYASRLNWGGYINVLIPAYVALALMVGLLIARLPSWRPLYQNMTLFALAAQMLWMLYNPLVLIPKQKSVVTGQQFLEKLAQQKGEVLLPERQFVQTRIGKKSYTLGMAAADLLRTNLGERSDIQDKLLQEIEDAIAAHRFSLILPGGLIPMPGLKKHYIQTEDMQFPQEYVTGSTNFLRTMAYVPSTNANQTAEPAEKPDLSEIPDNKLIGTY